MQMINNVIDMQGNVIAKLFKLLIDRRVGIAHHPAVSTIQLK